MKHFLTFQYFSFFLSSHILFYFQHLWLSDFFSLLFIWFYSYLHLICPFVQQYVLLRMSPKGIFCFKCHHSIYIDYFLSYNKYVGWVGSSIYLADDSMTAIISRVGARVLPPTFRAFITCTGLALSWFSIWINKPRNKSFICSSEISLFFEIGSCHHCKESEVTQMMNTFIDLMLLNLMMSSAQLGLLMMNK